MEEGLDLFAGDFTLFDEESMPLKIRSGEGKEHTILVRNPQSISWLYGSIQI
jgi:hypothetical protein